MSSADVFALSIHADYRCRHSGACCSADWDVPIELPVYRTLKHAVECGRLQPQASARHLVPFVVEPDLPEDAAAMLERTEAGECVFLDRGTKLCIVHRDLGEPSLPATCRYFPRLALRDDRGTFITLVALLSNCRVDVVSRRLSSRRLSPGRMRSRPATTRVLSSLVTTCHRCCRRRC